MKTIIAGSREIPYPRNLELVREAVELSGWKEQITEIVSGVARGIDSAAILYAKELKSVTLTKMKANWKLPGRSAGIVRNAEMAKYADALIAIWDGKSPGTKNMIEVAREKGLKVFVHNVGASPVGGFAI